MQLRCNRHWVSGGPRLLPCSSCMKELRKKSRVDNRNLVRPSTNLSPAASSSAENPGRNESTRSAAAKLPPSRPAVVAPSSIARVVATQLRKRRSCIGCQRDAVGYVFGLLVCDVHGEWINRLPIALPCVGLGYLIAASAIVQALRERQSMRRAS